MSVALKDGREFPAASLVRDGDVLRFGFAQLPGSCSVRVTPFAGGWTFKSVAFDVVGVESLTLAHVKPGCRRWYGDLACLVSDERSGVALRPYQPILRTACDGHDVTRPHSLYGPPDNARFPLPEEVANGLVIIADASGGFVGRRFGLSAGPRERLAGLLKSMTVAAGAPRSPAGGAWSLEAPENRGSYLFSTLMDVGSAGDRIELGERGGVTTMHPYAWWENYGLYEINTNLFPRGLADLKEVVRKFRDAGFLVDFHHLTHCIQYIEPIFMPVFTADPDEVIARCSYTLARPFAPGDTEMYVNERPWDGHAKIMASHSNGNALRIGRELVQYNDFSRERPYRFAKIVRGRFATQYCGVRNVTVSRETFPVGTRVDYLQQRYGSFYPKPGSKLMERVSDRIAEARNANGFVDGAWVKVAKHFPLPYAGVTNAVGLWVKGDASGALLNVQLEQAVPKYLAYSEHYIRVDFSGWRYFALHLRERDAYDYPKHRWPYSHNRLNTATEVYRTEIMGQSVEYVNLWLNDIPAGGTTRVEVTDVRAVGRHPIEIADGVVTLNGEDVRVPFVLESGEYAELANGAWTKFSAKGEPIARRCASANGRCRSRSDWRMARRCAATGGRGASRARFRWRGPSWRTASSRSRWGRFRASSQCRCRARTSRRRAPGSAS